MAKRTYKRDAAGRFSGSGGGVKGAAGRAKKNRTIRKAAQKRGAVRTKNSRADRKLYKAKKRVVSAKRNQAMTRKGMTGPQKAAANYKRGAAKRKKIRAKAWKK